MSEKATAEQMMMPKHGEFCWTEVATDNLEKCLNFYSEVFGWNIKKSENEEISGVDYREFSTAGSQVPSGGIYELNEKMCEGTVPPPHFMNYVAVTDVDESATKAFELGGKIISPPMDIPNVGRFCVVQDPTGASISMITLKH